MDASDRTDQGRMAAGDTRPFRRKVFYIPGYDPIHPRRYRELYRKESADQALISGYQIKLLPKAAKGRYGWRVASDMEAQPSQADIDVLVWSDIVRSSMGHSIPQTYLQLARTAWCYIGSGALFRLMRLRKGPVIAALYPVVMLLMQLALALAVAAGIGWAISKVLPWPVGLLGLMVVPFILRGFKARDGKFFAYYLMHDYAHSASHKGATPPELLPRMAEFQAAIRAALEDDVDEVLVVGHSSGAHMGVQVLADLIRAGLPQGRAKLAFLSLGQVVPMVSFLPAAGPLRRDLHLLAQEPRITWVDVTAPGDGCAFALCDPVAVSGVAPTPQLWPLVISASFRQTLSEARWAELKRRYFRLHFQYLCAFDRPKDYDYFRITAGPVTLADRFAERGHSKSRISKPVNGHSAMAADPA